MFSGTQAVARAVSIVGLATGPGEPVTLCLGAANRDPAAFTDPERFDVERSPNPHLAFGAGIHACAGMALARIEGKVAIGALFARFPELALAGAPTRRQRIRFRGLARLPVRTR